MDVLDTSRFVASTQVGNMPEIYRQSGGQSRSAR
jgi:hypothetical protein